MHTSRYPSTQHGWARTSFCLPAWLLALAPLVVGLVLLALIVLMGFYIWRVSRDIGDNQRNGADSALFIGLMTLSVIAIVFFAAIVILGTIGTCSSTV